MYFYKIHLRWAGGWTGASTVFQFFGMTRPGSERSHTSFGGACATSAFNWSTEKSRIDNVLRNASCRVIHQLQFVWNSFSENALLFGTFILFLQGNTCVFVLTYRQQFGLRSVTTPFLHFSFSFNGGSFRKFPWFRVRLSVLRYV